MQGNHLDPAYGMPAEDSQISACFSSQFCFLPPMAARALARMAASLAASTARASAAGLRTPGILLATRQRVGGLAAITHRSLGTPTYQPLQLHSFSASAVASVNDIAAIVGDELKYEKESYTQPVSACQIALL